MPEGPECRRVYEGLHSKCIGKKLTGVEILGGRFAKKPPVGLEQLQLPLEVTGGGVKGKFIWLELEGEVTAWITLGMSGFWSIYAKPHAHIKLVFDSGLELFFIDQRRFGTLKFASKVELDAKLKTLGVDALNDSTASVYNTIRSFERVPNKTVVEALMDQRLFAGIGNYIKCEMLYRSRISPNRLVKDLTDNEIQLLWDYSKLISRASYTQGGASIRNYQQVTGETGDFVFEFEVYGKREDPHGNLVIREKTADGRTTHWVPSLQQ
jgi:formamidopyrimidine-DNA glycosylase